MKLTKETIELIRYGLSQGMSIKAVCGKAGIAVDTYYRWKRTDKDFRDMVDSTQYDVEAKALQAMKNQANKDWRIWAWILERRFPQEWQKTKEVTINTQQQTGADVVISMLQQISQRDQKKHNNK